ncbi:MAG: hypothetical protein EOO38_18695, partial [Cytophagaceae bacterium]
MVKFHYWKGEKVMPKISEPVFRNLTESPEIALEPQASKNIKAALQKGQQSRLREGLEKVASGAEKVSLRNSQVLRPALSAPGN